MFAGAWRDRLPGGWLWQCRECHLGFRHPRLPIEQMNAMYANGAQTVWRYAFEDRPDWLIARQWIADCDNSVLDVLDVGCADGHFLVEGVSARHRRYGIEINPAASAAAISVGVRWIGARLEDIAVNADQCFDVITAFDVLEHVFDPRSFVAQAARLLRKDGRLLIATGNLSAPTFRFMGAKYWYAGLAEHVSFISPAWFETSAQALELRQERSARYSHASGSRIRVLRETAANSLYRVAPKAVARLRQLSRHSGRATWSSALDLTPPSWMTARDHFITEFRRA
jgi:2-polyprenyl-3-methyl-5-hydroxy-6-metoxy-1,4-benzoquinol methylase